MFVSCGNKGFQLIFKNGYMVSCQFGTMNYCERRSFDNGRIGEEEKISVVRSNDCEVAVIKDREFVTGDIIDKMGIQSVSGDGLVCGWVKADEVAKIIAFVSALE